MRDSLLEQQGTTVMLLPPFSPEYNPVELLWAYLKVFGRGLLGQLAWLNFFLRILCAVGGHPTRRWRKRWWVSQRRLLERWCCAGTFIARSVSSGRKLITALLRTTLHGCRVMLLQCSKGRMWWRYIRRKRVCDNMPWGKSSRPRTLAEIPTYGGVPPIL
jgi:hypothetical protein